MGGRRIQWGYLGAEQPGFAILENHITFSDLSLAGTQCLDFPSLKGDTRLEAFTQIVIVPRALIAGDSIVGLFCFLFAHGRHYTVCMRPSPILCGYGIK